MKTEGNKAAEDEKAKGLKANSTDAKEAEHAHVKKTVDGWTSVLSGAIPFFWQV